MFYLKVEGGGSKSGLDDVRTLAVFASLSARQFLRISEPIPTGLVAMMITIRSGICPRSDIQRLDPPSSGIVDERIRGRSGIP